MFIPMFFAVFFGILAALIVHHIFNDYMMTMRRRKRTKSDQYEQLYQRIVDFEEFMAQEIKKIQVAANKKSSKEKLV